MGIAARSTLVDQQPVFSLSQEENPLNLMETYLHAVKRVIRDEIYRGLYSKPCLVRLRLFLVEIPFGISKRAIIPSGLVRHARYNGIVDCAVSMTRANELLDLEWLNQRRSFLRKHCANLLEPSEGKNGLSRMDTNIRPKHDQLLQVSVKGCQEQTTVAARMQRPCSAP